MDEDKYQYAFVQYSKHTGNQPAWVVNAEIFDNVEAATSRHSIAASNDVVRVLRSGHSDLIIDKGASKGHPKSLDVICAEMQEGCSKCTAWQRHIQICRGGGAYHYNPLVVAMGVSTRKGYKIISYPDGRFEVWSLDSFGTYDKKLKVFYANEERTINEARNWVDRYIYALNNGVR